MGLCVGRTGARRSARVPGGSAAVSLDRVRASASNAASTAARYHCSKSGGRSLAEDYDVLLDEVLGEGCSGTVVVARGRLDGRRYALKRIQKSQVRFKALQQLTAEVEIYLTLDHPHVAKLRDVYDTEAEISLLTECCDGGELYSRLSKLGKYSEADAAQASRQMLLAVSYLHAHSIVHRDLKLENFLYEGDEAAAPLKLIDFGFAKICNSASTMLASCGSIAYVSPDVLSGAGYGSKCDLWSLGVIVFMLLLGYPPFHGSEKDMKAKILAGNVDWSHSNRWKGVSDDAVHFLRSLLVRDPADRLDARQALNHRWLTSACSSQAPALGKETLRALKRYADASRARRAVLQLLAQELAPYETRELRQTFLAMDRTGKGTISLSELKDAIRGQREAGSSPMPSPMSAAASPKTPAARLRRAGSGVINELFDVLDANGDEQVYYSDFLAAAINTRSIMREESLRSAFHRLDADGSGSISASDLRKVVGDTFEGVNVELLVQEADVSGKGDELDFGGFVRLLEDYDSTPMGASAQEDNLLLPVDRFRGGR